jgi:DMSO/TMAO reductase YedYZ molybdopterin-dependent catalytic subunit
MKLSKHLWFALILALVLASCQAAPAPVAVEEPAAIPEATQAAAPEPMLILIGQNGEKAITQEELLALPQVEGQAGMKSSTGKIFPPAAFKGVLLTDLLKLVDGADPSLAVQVEAQDGYTMTFSYEQLEKGTFITYDPATGDEISDAGPLQAILAYEMDGSPLNEQQDGKLRLVVISEKPNQVVDGHWSVKFVTKLTVKPLTADWALKLQGAIEDTIDRGSFESCSTGKCHQASWQDDKAQTWTGVPLYLLVGRVDDENKHNDDAYNHAIAEVGYSVDVVATDGYTVTFDSKRLLDNPNIMVAYAVNDNPLSDKDFPLKLVGSDLAKNEMVGMIDKIVLHIVSESTPVQVEPAATEPAAPETPVEAPVSDGNKIAIAGKLDKPLELTRTDLVSLGAGKVTVEHPKKGPQEVEGISIKSLLENSQVQASGKKVVLIASDGYAMELSLETVMGCDLCVVAFDSNDSFKSVMSGMDTAYWVKDLVKIEVR